MLFSTGISTVLLTSLAALTTAAPTVQTRGVNTRSWSALEEKYYHAVGDVVARFVKTPSFPTPPACNIPSAQMNFGDLPPPSEGLVLSHIVVGRGSQNYTCDPAKPTDAPVQIGAVATLFNASCIAGLYPNLLALMPPVSMKFPTPSDPAPLAPANIWRSGHHFFTADGVPFFELVSENGNYGQMACKKAGATPAPDTKNVPWLKLSAKDLEGVESTFSEVYRLNTVGGQPPATCEGRNGPFEVEYAAEYWFWKAA